MIPIGIDPHKDTHTAAAVADTTGQLLDELTVPGTDGATSACIPGRTSSPARAASCALHWRTATTSMPPRAFLLAAGELVLRVGTRMTARERTTTRPYGKSDSIDALAVARAALREPNPPRATHDPKLRELKLLVDHREDWSASAR